MTPVFQIRQEKNLLKVCVLDRTTIKFLLKAIYQTQIFKEYLSVSLRIYAKIQMRC